jgi:hypothetical protein
LRVLTQVGETLGNQPKTAAIEFCPKAPRIIRAEVLQEWASRVKEGQEAVIEDDTGAGARWHGKVKHVSDWYTHRRSMLQEPFQYNDVRTLECLVSVDGGGTAAAHWPARARDDPARDPVTSHRDENKHSPYPAPLNGA